MTTETDYSSFLIGGKYMIQSLIGSGSMSTVYKGIKRGTSKPVAVKIMKRNLIEDEEIVTRFVREVKACMTLEHKNIIRVFDAGTLSTGESYMVMEFLAGRSLADILESEKVLSPARAIEIICQAADGLGVAHGRGYFHRDVKPENLMVVPSRFQRDCVKVLDFGVAKMADSLNAGDKFATAPGDVLGTPLFMSPEQITGSKIDGRSDVYSLGCILYYCLCGKTPIQGDNAIAVMKNHLDAVPPHLNYYAPKRLPDEINFFVQRAIAKQAEDRYRSMSEFASKLRELSTPPLLSKIQTMLGFDGKRRQTVSSSAKKVRR